MIALIEEISGHHAVHGTLLLAAGAGKVSVVFRIMSQVKVLKSDDRLR